MTTLTFVNGPDFSSLGSREARRSVRSQLTIRQHRAKRLGQDQGTHLRWVCSCETDSSAALSPPGARKKARAGESCPKCGGLRRSQSKPQLVASPEPLLGPPRGNPFQRSYVDVDPQRVAELGDYCLNVLWPGFRKAGSFAQGFFRTIFVEGAENPLVLSTILYAASIHQDVVLSRNNTIGYIGHKVEQMKQKGMVLKSLQDALSAGGKQNFDMNGIVFAVTLLAVNEVMPEPTARRMKKQESPFTSPLIDMHWLHVFINSAFSATHMEGLQAILEEHGGIENVTAYGVAWHLSLGSLMHATATLTKPALRLIFPDNTPYRYSPPLEYLQLNVKPNHTVDNRGFHQLRTVGIKEELVRVFLDLNELSLVFQLFYGGSSGLQQDDVGDCRLIVQHRLMSMPEPTEPIECLLDDDLSNMVEDPRLALKLYELCRLSALLYSMHVTFPIPYAMMLQKKVIPQIQTIIGEIWHHPCRHSKFSDPLIWCIMIAGIAVSDRPEQQWFVESLDELLWDLQIQSWKQLHSVLVTCAWLDIACDSGGLLLWKKTLSYRGEIVPSREELVTGVRHESDK